VLRAIVGYMVSAFLNWVYAKLRREIRRRKAEAVKAKKTDELIKKLEESKTVEEHKNAVDNIAGDFGDM